jgi:hypothetical protein
MAMNMVVSVDEAGHEGPRVGQGAEAFGEHGCELQRLEPRLGVIPNSG